jgi:hypothetical protein
MADIRHVNLVIKGNGNIRDLPSTKGKILHVANPSDTMHVLFDKPTIDGKPITSGSWIKVKFLPRVRDYSDDLLETELKWRSGWIHNGIAVNKDDLKQTAPPPTYVEPVPKEAVKPSFTVESAIKLAVAGFIILKLIK